MSEWKFTADLQELETVCKLLAFSPPSETEGEGVWVRTVNGVREWSVCSDGTMWEVRGDLAEGPQATRCIPSRSIWDARIFALTSSSREVEFSIPDDLVCVVNSEVGATVMDLPRETEIPGFPMYVTETASAATTVGALYDLLFRARTMPLGPSNDELPDARLFIEHDAISVFVDWSIRNGSRSTYRIPAQVVGEAESLLPMGSLFDLIREMDRDQDVTIRISGRDKRLILVEGEHFRAAVECMPTTADRHHDELLKALSAMRACRVRMVETGTFVLTTQLREFQVEVTDRPNDMITVRTEVCRGVPLSLELLTQINDTNAALAGARLWVHEGVVWAGLDISVSVIDELEVALRTLEQQLTGFDVFLPGISGL